MSRRQLVALTIATLTIAFASVLATRHVAAGGGGCHEPVTEGRGTNIDLKNNCMVTTVLRVDPGDTVTFTNRDEADHTVTGVGRFEDGASFGSFEPIPQGGTVAHTFATNGVYAYYCLFHPGMVGAIVVGDGSGPGAATGDGAAPLGVTPRSPGDSAGTTHEAAALGLDVDGFSTTRIAIFAGAAFLAAAALAAALRRRGGRSMRQIDV